MKKQFSQLLAICLLCGTFAQPQDAPFLPAVFDEMKAKYPDKMAVYLKLTHHVHLDIVGDTVLATTQDYYDLLHLDERAMSLAKDNVYSSMFKEVTSIEARTLVPQKNKYKAIEVTSFKEKSELSSGIFYDDYTAKTFVYPAVAPGVRTILKETKHIRDPHFLSAFYLASFVPVEYIEMVVTAHKDIDVRFKLFHADSMKLETSQTDKGKYKVYTWSAKDLHAYEIESGAPKSSYYLPHIAYHIASYQADGQTVKMLSDVADLYGWYSRFTEHLNADDNHLKDVVEQLVKGATTEEERVKRIFYWVQDNIKYIAFEDGLRGFVPHKPSYVYDKRYGDCKDMATLTNGMLKLAGIESHLTWIGSRDLPYRYADLPTPMVDNHMIVTYKSGGRTYFLDATSSNTYLGLPSSMIQGKEALVSLGNGKFEVAKVPVVDKQDNLFADTVRFSINGKTLQGSGVAKMSGYQRVYASYRITGNKQDREKDYLNGVLQKGSNKCFIEDYQVENLANKDLPLLINYRFRVEDYCKSVGDEIYLNLSLSKNFQNSQIDLGKRRLPLENDFCYTNTNVNILDIPEGYQVSYLPADAEYKHEQFGFRIAYRQENGKLIQEQTVYANYLLLTKPHFKDWNAMLKALQEAYREAIVLKRG